MAVGPGPTSMERMPPSDVGAPPALLRSAVLVAVVGLVLVVGPEVAVLPAAGWYLLSSVTLPLILLAYRPRRALPIVLVVAAALVVVGGVARTGEGVDPFHRHHDGGVVATEAAARMVVDGRNPYAADFSDALAPDHLDLDAVDEKGVANPLIDHYPYLPAAFLVHVPLAALGSWYDPRILYVLATAVALGAIARRPAPAPRRAAALAAATASGAVAAFLPWGANDSAAAALVVLAAFASARRPVLAGVLLALGVSLKALLVVAALPLGIMWLATSRRVAVRAALAAGVTLALTCVPYLLAAPVDFVEDVVSFNLGTTEMTYPASGVGLGAAFPGVVDGPLLIGLSAALVLAIAVPGAMWVRRVPRPEVALFVSGLIVLAGLLPARSFQLSYAPLMVLMWAPIWLPERDASDPAGPFGATAASA